MFLLSIEENIKRILKTNKYTKTLRPLYGLDRHIDKTMSLKNLSALKEDIVTQLETNEPRINLNSIDFENYENNLSVKIQYEEKENHQTNKIIKVKL